VRLLTKSATAQELGPEVAWLLAVIAHQEDAKRYCGAVTYWNEQLMPLCGFRSKGRLTRARQRAVDAGWLHYEAGGRTQAGRYWCLVPSAYEQLPDGTCDESDPVHNRTANASGGVQNRTANGPDEQSCANGIERQTDPKPNGKRSPFYPIPNPSPKEGTTSPEPSLADSIKDEWNKAGLTQCRKMSEDRKRAVRARSKDPDWLANWQDAVARAGQSSFCRGETERGWTASIEWFLKPDTVTQLLEGQFDNRRNGHANGDAESSRIMQENTARLLAEKRGDLA
jgi:hypothetical protein